MLQTSLVNAGHLTDQFDCGVPDLDDFIRNRAVKAGQLGVCRPPQQANRGILHPFRLAYWDNSTDYWRWHDGFYAAADEAIARGEHVQQSRL